MVCLIKNGSVADILASFVPIPIPEYVQWMIYRATLQYQFAGHITSTHNKNMKNNSKMQSGGGEKKPDRSSSRHNH